MGGQWKHTSTVPVENSEFTDSFFFNQHDQVGVEFHTGFVARDDVEFLNLQTYHPIRKGAETVHLIY